MLKAKGLLLTLVLGILAVLVAGKARLGLDDAVREYRESFTDVLYLPRGDAIHIAAFGFDAPVADLLYIKGILYQGARIQASGRPELPKKNHVYELFDLVTDLSPQLYEAYQRGSLFLTTTIMPENNENAIKLLKKGVDFYDKRAAEGIKEVADPRWLLHLYAATIYDTTIQLVRRQTGDLLGAATARKEALAEYRAAATSPDAPMYVVQAATAYEGVFSGGGGVEKPLEASLPILVEVYKDAVAKGDTEKVPGLKEKIEATAQQIAGIKATRAMEAELAKAGKAFFAKHGKPAVDVQELLRDKLIPGLPDAPLATDKAPEKWLAMPDGTFRSEILSGLETGNCLDIIYDALQSYALVHGGKPPKSLDELVTEHIVDALPEPPLKELGQEFEYDSTSGLVHSVMPFGPEPAPSSGADKTGSR